MLDFIIYRKEKNPTHTGRNQGEHYYGNSILDRACNTFVILQTQSYKY